MIFQCPPSGVAVSSLAYYSDASGVEGTDVCMFVLAPVPSVSFNAAVTSCQGAGNAQLLSSKQRVSPASDASSLLGVAYMLLTNTSGYSFWLNAWADQPLGRLFYLTLLKVPQLSTSMISQKCPATCKLAVFTLMYHRSILLAHEDRARPAARTGVGIWAW